MRQALSIIDKQHGFSYSDHASRLCRHFLKSRADHFSNEDILELFLFACGAGAGSRAIVEQLFSRFGDFASIVTSPVGELRKISGMDEGAIIAIKLIRESALRLLRDEITDNVIINNKTALFRYCKARMRNLKVEQFHIFYMDKRYQLIADEIVSEGTIDHAPVYPREVLKRTLDLGASSVILAHNHPSGDPAPSEMDKRMTRDIAKALALLGIEVIDHVVIGGNRHYSFADNGLIPFPLS